MNSEPERCPYNMVHDVQMNNLAEDIKELHLRVRSLETTLTRGVMLLVANLVAVIVSLGQQLLQP
ncbi:MAG: hypothetical protein IT364_16035 [Candidatus Hydrogenedentes bacterium]|nr:hypothetical protein [Candidatus Hydrogenedentota bacterium]